jgi:hypothetical protein
MIHHSRHNISLCGAESRVVTWVMEYHSAHTPIHEAAFFFVPRFEL